MENSSRKSQRRSKRWWKNIAQSKGSIFNDFGVNAPTRQKSMVHGWKLLDTCHINPARLCIAMGLVSCILTSKEEKLEPIMNVSSS
jgi:hypothetical protein